MGGLHPLRHLDVPQRQVPSHAQHQPATRRAIRKPHGRRPADHRRSQQPHRRIRLRPVLDERRNPRHHHRLARGACRSRSRVAPVVADAVHGVCAAGGRPGHLPEWHHHRPCHSHTAHVDARVDADARLVQIPAGHRPADRHRRRLAARRVDDLPVGRAAGRYLRGCGGWPAYDGRGRSRRGESCDLRAAWHVERLLPYGDRHDYGGRAGGLGQRALETVGIGPLAQFRSHRAAGFGCGDRRMLGGRAKPHHSARPL